MASRAEVRPRDELRGAVLDGGVVDGEADGQNGVVRVRVEGPVLVPLDGRADAWLAWTLRSFRRRLVYSVWIITYIMPYTKRRLNDFNVQG